MREDVGSHPWPPTVEECKTRGDHSLRSAGYGWRQCSNCQSLVTDLAPLAPADLGGDHSRCMRVRLIGSCGALAECEHDGVKVYTEWSHWQRPLLAVAPEREAELRATVGACV